LVVASLGECIGNGITLRRHVARSFHLVDQVYELIQFWASLCRGHELHGKQGLWVVALQKPCQRQVGSGAMVTSCDGLFEVRWRNIDHQPCGAVVVTRFEPVQPVVGARRIARIESLAFSAVHRDETKAWSLVWQ